MAGIEIKAPTALVTGSSRGIGRGIEPKLAECGVGRPRTIRAACSGSVAPRRC